MVILTTIYVIAAVLLLFGAAIFVHEWGHYFVARMCGMKVEEFAIGFGKILWKKEKDGILYTVRMIPAGGFVKLPQMITSEAIEGKSEEEDAEPLPEISPWAKIAVAVAGPIMNVVFAVVLATLIYFVGLPESVTPPVVGVVDPESAEYQAGIRRGDLIVQIDDEQMSSWRDILMYTALSRSQEFEVTFERAENETTNEFTRTLQSVKNEVLGVKLLKLDPDYHPMVGEVKSGQPGEEAGLLDGDVILSFGDVPIYGVTQLIKLIQGRPSQETEMIVKRGDDEKKLRIVPRDNLGKGQIGVILTSDTTQVYRVRKPGPTPWENITGVVDMMVRTLSALWHHEETGIGAKDLSGPVGILAMLGAMVKTDYRLALNFLVLLNVNLAILNMLPIPVLDGGHTVMGLIEGIFRRKIPAKLQEWATTGFAVALISLMLYVTFHDVFMRRGIFVDMFNSDTEVQAPADPSPTASE